MARARSARQKDEDARQALEEERKKTRGLERNFKRKTKKPCNGCNEKEKAKEEATVAEVDEGVG